MRKLSKITFSVALPCMLTAVHASTALHQGFVPERSTDLIEVRQGLYLSDMARSLARSGFETSGGQWVDFQNWYKPHWVDTRVSWLTQINPSFGFIWGFSTGERAEKYRIDPGFRLGFLLQTQPSKHSVLAFGFSQVLGGRLQEKPCLADYGEIGGTQAVNCRLAATTLEPSETLKFLINERPAGVVQLGFNRSFH